MTKQRFARLMAVALVAMFAMPAPSPGQARRGAPPRPPARPAAQPALVIEARKFSCPHVLGEGVQTKRIFFDVSIGRDPAGGIIIPLPLHTGPLTLTFDLHT